MSEHIKWISDHVVSVNWSLVIYNANPHPYAKAKTKSTRKGYRSFLDSTWDAAMGFKAGTSFMCSRLPSREGLFAFADRKGRFGERVSYAYIHPAWIPRAGHILPGHTSSSAANGKPIAFLLVLSLFPRPCPCLISPCTNQVPVQMEFNSILFLKQLTLQWQVVLYFPSL